MLNEIAEFEAYTGKISYTAERKSDNSYLGRFTVETILERYGFARLLTIIARGYMFADGVANVEKAHRALCAWCSVPDNEKTTPREEWQFATDYRDLHKEIPELVDADGRGWFYRHICNILTFAEQNPSIVSKNILSKAEEIKKNLEIECRKKLLQYQVPIFSQETKGAWVLRFDDVLADAKELGALRNDEIELPDEIKSRIAEAKPREVPAHIIELLIKYYIANKPEDSDFVVIPVSNFDAYLGGGTFSKKYWPKLKEPLVEKKQSFGVSKYRICKDFLPF